eukprot:COSAG01_NODE_4035_length_5414_cov_13.342551_5_plen_66_part_00
MPGTSRTHSDSSLLDVEDTLLAGGFCIAAPLYSSSLASRRCLLVLHLRRHKGIERVLHLGGYTPV